MNGSNLKYDQEYDQQCCRTGSQSNGRFCNGCDGCAQSMPEINSQRQAGASSQFTGGSDGSVDSNNTGKTDYMRPLYDEKDMPPRNHEFIDDTDLKGNDLVASPKLYLSPRLLHKEDRRIPTNDQFKPTLDGSSSPQPSEDQNSTCSIGDIGNSYDAEASQKACECDSVFDFGQSHQQYC